MKKLYIAFHEEDYWAILQDENQRFAILNFFFREEGRPNEVLRTVANAILAITGEAPEQFEVDLLHPINHWSLLPEIVAEVERRNGDLMCETNVLESVLSVAPGLFLQLEMNVMKLGLSDWLKPMEKIAL